MRSRRPRCSPAGPSLYYGMLDVIAEDGKVIGRIYRAYHSINDRWIWSLYGRGPAKLADSLEAAKVELKAAVSPLAR